jgi:hypothetical protein
VTSPSSHIHAIRQERTHIHGHQDHIVSPREQRHEVDQEKFGQQPAGQFHARGRQACRQQQTVRGDPLGSERRSRAESIADWRTPRRNAAQSPKRQKKMLKQLEKDTTAHRGTVKALKTDLDKVRKTRKATSSHL